ncbi:hypothetical protein [Pseudobdellovibrio exovorus]|uniref:Mercuric transport protein MerT n=1 Tax=Pseudobdellovibrio exovorus JSS TaxID=1184267 RepID=M4VBS4_9BACT|nr:hypothetical protein [Pseudobdellovibrio exovorus]AGH95940.1 hypothetical protein A11Q_1724 [Pseudobdellovibrio exovorus JSS]
MTKIKESLLNYFTLFGSLSTLLCCALPALLVSLGLGAVLAGMASNFPALIWMSEHKVKFFIFAGSMLALNGFLLWRNRNAPCPIDPKLREACISGRKASRNLYIVSVGVFVLGFLFAYVLPVLMF